MTDDRPAREWARILGPLSREERERRMAEVPENLRPLVKTHINVQWQHWKHRQDRLRKD